MAEEENIIVNLKINDEIIPYPYNENILNYNNNTIDSLYLPLDNEKNNDVQTDNEKESIVYLLNEFKEKNKNQEWPNGTSVCCYWCCHPFQGPPMGIPIKYVDKKFEVFGCFCSLSCAAAYNFKSQGNLDEMWERYNLINALYRTLSNNNIVKPAPDRLSLSMFGGRMSIEEFRKYNEGEKIINILFPPMVAITQQIEELNEYDISNNKRYIPIDFNRITKNEEKMLKRVKPLVDSKNSIETFIELF